jgi:hypothetical protein
MNFVGKKLEGSRAADSIHATICRGRDVGTESGFPFILKCLAAYPPHAFPWSERVCRLSRVANLPHATAVSALAALDNTIDYSSLDHVSLTDDDLKYAYEYDTANSGVPLGAPVILACRFEKCVICGALLLAPHDSGDLNETALARSKENDIKVVTEHGSCYAHEFKRECSACLAIHFSSHAVIFGKSRGRGHNRPLLQAVPYPWERVDALRVHGSRFYGARILDLALRNYCKALTPFHTSAMTAVAGNVHLHVPSTGDDIKDGTFIRACTMRAILFYRESLPPP